VGEITAPSGGIYGGSGSITATGGGAGVSIELSVAHSSSGICTLSNFVTGTTTTATVHYMGAGACVIDAVQDGIHGTDTAQQTTLTIAKATLAIVASSPTVTYGTTAPAITPSYLTLLNGDTASVISPAPSCSSPVTSISGTGAYTSTCSGPASTSNYAITYVAGKVTVIKASATVSLSTSKKALTIHEHEQLTVRVSFDGDQKGTGDVRLYNGSKLLKTVTLRDGAATTTLGLLLRGTHKLHAVYLGNADIDSAGSAIVDVKVKK
jgi:hypothetical protein